MRNNSTRAMARIGFLAAAGFILTFFEFPILPSAPFLKYDASEVPAMIAAFSMGPVAGFIVETLKCVLFHLLGKNTTGVIGTGAMWLAGSTYVVIGGLAYRLRRDIRGALVALFLASGALAAVMFFANIYFFLGLWGIPEPLRWGLATSAVLPFNFLKGLISSVITFLLYKRVSKLLRS